MQSSLNHHKNINNTKPHHITNLLPYNITKILIKIHTKLQHFRTTKPTQS